MIDVKHELTKVILSENNLPTDEQTIKDYKKIFWYNLRASNMTGLRLTEAGLEHVMKAKITVYEVDLPVTLVISPQILIWLDNFIQSPYYITKKQITVLTEYAALELMMFAGDLQKYGYEYSLTTRFNK